jgi:hypothetical protein
MFSLCKLLLHTIILGRCKNDVLSLRGEIGKINLRTKTGKFCDLCHKYEWSVVQCMCMKVVMKLFWIIFVFNYLCFLSSLLVCTITLWDHVAVRVCVCVSPLIVARQRLGKKTPIVARQRLGKNPPIVARQRLGRNVIVGKNTHATIEELLDASFSMRLVSYQGK